MRRIVYAALTVLVVAVAALSALPLFVSSEGVRQQILDSAVSITGREMSFRGTPQITFNPFLGFELNDVVFDDPDAAATEAPFLRMERLQGRLNILPALTGRAEMSNYRFVRPQFNLRVYGDGTASWAFPQGRVWSVLNAARAAREATPAGQTPDLSGIATLQLGTVEIVDGTFNYDDRKTGRQETFTNFNGQLSWPGTSSNWSMDGSFIWRNEAFKFGAVSSQPLLLLSGGTAPFTAKLSSGAVDFSFEGDANLIANLHLTGNAKLATPSLRRLVGLYAAALPPGSTLSSFSISGKLDATPGRLAFTGANVELDGNAGSGALQLSFDKQVPKLAGTIAAGQIDLTPYLADLTADGVEQAAGHDSPPMLAMDVDLRVSAATAKAARLLLSDVAATVSLQKGEAAFELGNASVFGGIVTAKFKLRRQEGNYNAELNAMASGFDAAAAIAMAGAKKPPLSGKASFEARLAASGKDIAEIRTAITGLVTGRIENGILTGVDFADLMRQSQTKNPDVPKLAGETAFRTVEANVILNRSHAEINRIAISNSRVLAQIAGRADLAQGGLALRMLLTPSQPAADGSPAPEARLVVGGSLANPVLTRAPALGNPASPGVNGSVPLADPVSLGATSAN